MRWGRNGYNKRDLSGFLATKTPEEIATAFDALIEPREEIEKHPHLLFRKRAYFANHFEDHPHLLASISKSSIAETAKRLAESAKEDDSALLSLRVFILSFSRIPEKLAKVSDDILSKVRLDVQNHLMCLGGPEDQERFKDINRFRDREPRPN